MFSSSYLVEPIMSGSLATIGIPNKDLHDGIISYIHDFGKPPGEKKDLTNNYIPNSKNGLYLGYPNEFHSVSALLTSFNVHIFYSGWVAIIIGITISSLSIFLLSKLFFDDLTIAAISGGLFAISSIRIPLGVVTSISMFYSYTLLLPSFLLIIYLLNDPLRTYTNYILASIVFCVVLASYSGTVVILLLLLTTLIFFEILLYQKKGYKTYLIFVAVVIPFLIITLLPQKTIYWQNIFPTSIDYDPYELSQKMLPIDQPIYMLFYSLSFLLILIQMIKKVISKDKINFAGPFFLFINLALMSLFFYDVLFNYYHQINNTKDLISIDPDGFFGGLNHQKVSRLALFQPFIFVFYVGLIGVIFKNKIFKIIILISLFLCFSLVRINPYAYPWIEPEIYQSYYNEKDKTKILSLLSHQRLFKNKIIWNIDNINVLNFFKKQNLQKSKILLVDQRKWTEETIANWGSVYIRHKINLVEEGSKINDYDYIWFIKSENNNQDIINLNNFSITYQSDQNYVLLPRF
ncbi:hypothetical protein KC726_04370 [Candidatus Woesebacteria bacterium]|nr:hypothetical protein [Candidatus Woesebacteria bacterium]